MGPRTCEWAGGGMDKMAAVSLAQAPRMLDKTEIFGRTSSHSSYFYLFSLVIYLLEHLSIGTFY